MGRKRGLATASSTQGAGDLTDLRGRVLASERHARQEVPAHG
jgi:hypothetical protein